MRLGAVDGELLCQWRGLADGSARLGDILVHEMTRSLNVRGVDSLQQRIAILEIEFAVKTTKVTVAVGGYAVALIPFGVHQCVDVDEARVSVVELHGDLVARFVNQQYFVAASGAVGAAESDFDGGKLGHESLVGRHVFSQASSHLVDTHGVDDVKEIHSWFVFGVDRWTKR